MQVDNERFFTVCDLDKLPPCDRCQELIRSFLEAAEECVSTLGRARTSNSRSDLLCTYNRMVFHTDCCLKCNAI